MEQDKSVSDRLLTGIDMWPIELIEEHQINQVTIISATTYSGTFFAQRMCDLFATKISRSLLT